MNIIKMWGGLGNQMFLYALYIAMKKRGLEVKLDLSYYDYFASHNGYELERVFENVKADYADIEESEKLAIVKLDKWSRLKKKIFCPATQYIQIRKCHDAGYTQDVSGMDNRYLEGYFQSERYFEQYAEDVRKSFVFKGLDGINDDIIRKMRSGHSVSLHVRRGDYLNYKSSDDALCGMDYYNNALQYIRENVENPHFFVFSDDIEWCKEVFKGEEYFDEYFFVEGNSGKHSYYDMYYMSQCEHNVIANSTFSWWGAWLNANPDKIVVAPAHWKTGNKNIRATDIIPKDWIKV